MFWEWGWGCAWGPASAVGVGEPDALQTSAGKESPVEPHSCCPPQNCLPNNPAPSPFVPSFSSRGAHLWRIPPPPPRPVEDSELDVMAHLCAFGMLMSRPGTQVTAPPQERSPTGSPSPGAPHHASLLTANGHFCRPFCSPAWPLPWRPQTGACRVPRGPQAGASPGGAAWPGPTRSQGASAQRKGRPAERHATPPWGGGEVAL